MAPLCLIYIRITLGTVSFERKGVWAVEQSYGVCCIIICENEGMMAGMGSDFIK